MSIAEQPQIVCTNSKFKLKDMTTSLQPTCLSQLKRIMGSISFSKEIVLSINRVKIKKSD